MDEVPPFELFPGSGRVATRLTSLLRRVPGLAWPFIVLAALDFVILALASGNRWESWLSAVDRAAWALLPAAVIVGCPTAWRSARLVLIGAIAWSTISAAAALLWGLPFSTEMGLHSNDANLGLIATHEIASLAAPILILVGLSAHRRTETSWPAPVVILGLAATAVTVAYVGSNSWAYYNDSPYMFGDSVAQNFLLVYQLLAAFTLPVLGVLAWSSLSAVRAGEDRPRFWLALTGGSVALLCGYVINLVASWAFGALGYSAGAMDLYLSLSRVLTFVSVAAIGLLLFAFAVGLPSEQFDLGDPAEDPGDPAASADPAGLSADATA